MSDIEKIIEGLELIEIVVPSYKHARRRGMTDEEAETLVNWALEQAIIILEQLILGKSYSRVYRAIATRRKTEAGPRGHQEN